MSGQFWSVELHQSVECTGCIMEDDSDTRVWESKFYFVTDEKKEQDDFGEMIASMSGDQDYSYTVNFKQIHRFKWQQLKALKKALDEFEKKHPEVFE